MSPPDFTLIHGGGDPVRRQAAQWFARLRADDVSQLDRQQCQRWLSQDVRHRVAYERIEQLWSTLGEFAPHPEISERLIPAVPNRTRMLRNKARRRFVAGSGAVAASLVIALVAGRALWKPADIDATRYATGIGERRSLQLQDGSRIELDTSTQLRVRFSEGERQIVLDHGRAFFRVASETRPLVVRNEHGSVRAVGTQFEVFERHHQLTVALFEGRVDLLAPGDASSTPLATLDAGQRASVNGDQVRWEAPLVADTQAPTWLSGKLVFDDAPLQDAVSEFNRYSRQRIVLASAELGQLRISGVFASDNPDGFIEALQQVYGITETRSANGERVLHQRR